VSWPGHRRAGVAWPGAWAANQLCMSCVWARQRGVQTCAAGGPSCSQAAGAPRVASAG
jgi:hypothetical protein